MLVLSKDWEFNILGIDNYKKPGKFEHYYNFIRKNHNRIDGDVCEVGVFRGFSLLATAMLLKELKSTKVVIGYDTFEGFPDYSEKDKLENFTKLYQSKNISKEHYDDFKLNVKYKSYLNDIPIDVSNISSSGDFSNNSYDDLIKKIDFLKLDNIKLVKGEFKKTMIENPKKIPQRFCAALIDCDLYDGYKVSLPFIYNRLNRGGYIYLDEYYSLKFPGAKIACDEFFKNKSEKPEMHTRYDGEFERWGVVKK
jgi:hypothetical protein